MCNQASTPDSLVTLVRVSVQAPSFVDMPGTSYKLVCSAKSTLMPNPISAGMLVLAIASPSSKEQLELELTNASDHEA
jgi:hypothetical protein